MKVADSRAASAQTSRPLRVRNGRMARARDGLGFASAHACAVAMGLEYQSVVRFERGESSPLTVEGDAWRDAALKMAEALCVEPEALWPKEGRRVARAVRRAERAFLMQCGDGNGRTAPSETTPEQAAITASETARLHRAVGELPERTRTVLWARFGDETLEEVGHHFHISRQRVRQIVGHALDILRRNSLLKECVIEIKKGPKPIVLLSKIARCPKCKRSDLLSSEEGPDGRRIYKCGRCRPSLGPGQRAEVLEGKLVVQEFPGGQSYEAPGWDTPSQAIRETPLQRWLRALTSEDIARHRRQRALLHFYHATPAELTRWVETGELPARCARIDRAMEMEAG